MAMSIKNEEVERLAAEIAAATGVSKTEAIRTALLERQQKLAFRVTHAHRRVRLNQFLELEVWPLVSADRLCQPLDRGDEDTILGYGPEGV